MLTKNLSELSEQDIYKYHQRLCEELGLEAASMSFDYKKTKSGKVYLCISKSGLNKIREIKKISIDEILERETDNSYSVTVKVSGMDGRKYIEILSVDKKQKNISARSKMNLIEKTKKLATLSFCGLNWLNKIDKISLNVVDELNPVNLPRAYAFAEMEIVKPSREATEAEVELYDLKKRIKAMSNTLYDMHNGSEFIRAKLDTISGMYFNKYGITLKNARSVVEMLKILTIEIEQAREHASEPPLSLKEIKNSAAFKNFVEPEYIED